ncbi:hypothetical protein [Peribacillus deserti]|uniref:Major facilitator superfamily (MFS) profile domain-containing protein n=1 Tax=Peribacillus deserti TaxID=673318 RepID=A0A2N5M2G0_9BACI|nr:hypothetical protein [Peribacillus deserti]PLT28556.1 hypothetical protein CUU66_17890 [Peribacillus deserti]
MIFVFWGIHLLLFLAIHVRIYKQKKQIQYHFSMALTITAALSNTLLTGILLSHLFPDYTQAVIAATAVGICTGISLGTTLDFQSLYSGTVSGVMGGFMGPMIGGLVHESQAFVLFVVLEIIFSGFLLSVLFSVSLKREV